MATKKPSAKTPRSRLGTTAAPKRKPGRPLTAGTRTKRNRTGQPRTALVPTDEHIRVRAYYLYLQRDGRPGDPLDDWLRAEQELTGFTGEA